VDRDPALVIHELPLERRVLHGHYSRELPPVVSAEPGDTIAFSCPNSGWEYEHGVRFEPYDEELDAGHALVGPVEVRGAKAGGTLVVRVRSVVPGPWGVTLAHESKKIEWRLEDTDVPISVDGALFSAGDGHAAQGDVRCPARRSSAPSSGRS